MRARRAAHGLTNMPLMLVCPCGHRTALPEKSGSLKCSQCSAVLKFTCFSGSDPLDQWRSHIALAAFASPVLAVRGSVEFFVTSQGEGEANQL